MEEGQESVTGSVCREGSARSRSPSPISSLVSGWGSGVVVGTHRVGDKLVARGWVALAGGSAPGRGGGWEALPARPASLPTAPRCSSPGSAWQQRRQGGHPRLGEDMEVDNQTETWHQSFQAVLNALNQTLHGVILCPSDRPAAATRNASARAGRPGRNDNAYMYILFVMTLFAATVGSLILGYTRSRKVDKRSDPYHVYIKNRVSMI
ncbi:PREDICTED: potassium voltage-gated channel subfamily E member 3 [Calidris pugnax]|uniref:potassium voltage-gated channel subfamily E member 3 n=1 Tax=Calidris pugnax TaxID=198806 RepID=UPI00071DD78A|nr:PREDICTED: potassium voltage-gated channel subfamily E member 3 [Calidris pugnax]